MSESVATDPRRVRLGVPAFVDPSEDPWFWQQLATLGDLARFIVVDPDHQRRGGADQGYLDVVDLLRARGLPLVGYVDAAYGLTSEREVARQVRDWASRHGIRGVYLDRFGWEQAMFDDFAGVVLAARCAGAEFVVTNPGGTPAASYLALADITVTYEGPWPEYRDHVVDPVAAWWPAGRQAHLVHGVPPEHLTSAAQLAAERHAETVFFSDASGLRPWHRLPDPLVRGLRAGAGPVTPHWGIPTLRG